MNKARFWWLRVASRFIFPLRRFKWWRRWCMGKWILQSSWVQPGCMKWDPIPYESLKYDENW